MKHENGDASANTFFGECVPTFVCSPKPDAALQRASSGTSSGLWHRRRAASGPEGLREKPKLVPDEIKQSSCFD